jgi:hypothetical protein
MRKPASNGHARLCASDSRSVADELDGLLGAVNSAKGPASGRRCAQLPELLAPKFQKQGLTTRNRVSEYLVSEVRTRIHTTGHASLSAVSGGIRLYR